MVLFTKFLLKPDFGRMKGLPAAAIDRRYPSYFRRQNVKGEVSPEIFGEIPPVGYRRICSGFLAL